MIEEMHNRTFFQFRRRRVRGSRPPTSTRPRATTYICVDLAGLEEKQVGVECVEERRAWSSRAAACKPRPERHEGDSLSVHLMEIDEGRVSPRDRAAATPSRPDASRARSTARVTCGSTCRGRRKLIDADAIEANDGAGRRRRAFSDRSSVKVIDESDEIKQGSRPSLRPCCRCATMVIFPGTVVPLTDRTREIQTPDRHRAGRRSSWSACSRSATTTVDDPDIDDVYRVGTIARVLKLLQDARRQQQPAGPRRGAHRAREVSSRPSRIWRAIDRTRTRTRARDVARDSRPWRTAARHTAEHGHRISARTCPTKPSLMLTNIDTARAAGGLSWRRTCRSALVQKQELLETFDVADRLAQG